MVSRGIRGRLSAGLVTRMLAGLSTVAMGAALTGHAFAQTAGPAVVHDISVAPGPLEAGLLSLGRQASLRLVYPSKMTRGKQTGGARGSLAAGDALSRVLAGTGLSYTFTGTDTVQIVDPAAAGGSSVGVDDGSTPLQAIEIAGEAANVTEGTGLYTIGETSSAAALPLTLRQTPQSVTVMTDQQIKDQNVTDLRTALNNTPGLNREQHDSERYMYSARGFEIQNIQVNGVNVSTPPVGAYNSLYYSNLQMVEFDHVEVVRGATGLMSGAGEPSAAVNLVRKRPTEAFQAMVDVSAGSWNRAGTQVDVSGPLNADGSVRGRMAGAFDRGDSVVDFYDRERFAGFAALEVDLTEATLLSLSASYGKSDVHGVTFSGAFPVFYADGTRTDLPRSFSQSDDWAYWTSDALSLNAGIEHEFETGWTAKANYSYTRNTSDLLGIVWESTSFVARDGSGAFAYRDRYDDTRNRHALSGELSGSFELFGREHDAVAGFKASRLATVGNNFYDSGWYSPTDFFATNGSVPQPTGHDHFNVTEGEITETGAFGAVRLRPIDGVSLIAGARVSNWTNENNVFYVGTGTRTFDEFGYHGVVTPYLGLVVDIGENHSIYASYTDIFSPQNYKDINLQLLAPVTGQAYEAGVKGEYFDGRLNASLSVFHILQDNLAEDTGKIVGGQNVYRAIEGATSRGVEVSLSGEIVPGWMLYGGYAHFDITDSYDRPVLTASARDTVKLFTTYEFEDSMEGLTVGGGVRWQSETYKDGVGPNNDGILGTSDDRLTQDAYAVVDLMARYDFNANVSGSLNINNVFDQNYITAFRQGSQYGEPRSFTVSLRGKF